MLLIELLIDIFFLSDIALNFNTGYIFEQVSNLSIICHSLTCCATRSDKPLTSVLESVCQGL